MKIFNSKSAKKEVFEPLKAGHVGFYVCGPTVYDSPHLGHGRSAVSFDVIRRYFLYRGYSVKFVSNYTDVDDKMINRAKEENTTVSELADRVILEYEKTYQALGVIPADVQPKATEHILEMIEIISVLESKGFVYLLEDGVYFDVSKYEDYGKFSYQNIEDLQFGARVEVNDKKRNPQDFVLWKFKKEGEPFWESPWGDGRPGWHIECSAMSFSHLGEKFDIHGGGLDLKFPHHECEVAQSLSCFGKDSFARYWIHNGFIQIDNQKISKSLGNFFTLKDIFKKYDPKVVRFMFLQTHYRNPINFSDVLLDQAFAGLQRLHDFARSLEVFDDFGEGVFVGIDEFEEKFCNFMDNDFDTAGALGVVFEFVKEVNSFRVKSGLSKESVEEIISFLRAVDKVFAFIFPEEVSIDDEVLKKIQEREEARKSKDFQRSDEIRDELLEIGIILEDTPSGTLWKKK